MSELRRALREPLRLERKAASAECFSACKEPQRPRDLAGDRLTSRSILRFVQLIISNKIESNNVILYNIINKIINERYISSKDDYTRGVQEGSH